MNTHKKESALVTFAIAALCSLLFCSKGVFVKLALAQGATPTLILALRMGFALPFFVAAALWTSHGKAAPITGRQLLKLIGLGFVGYYISALVNFAGLQYVSVGLERIILYTYPSLVILGGVLFFRKKLSLGMVAACLIGYAGVCIGFLGEIHGPGSFHDLVLGTALVALSALTYATFILLVGPMIAEIGAIRFTAYVVGISCVMVMIHYALTEPLGQLFRQGPAVYGYATILAIAGTVLPSFLMGIGIRRAGAQRFAIIGTTGPIGTLVLAALLLGEKVHFLQAAGLFLSLAGGAMVSLLKEEKPAEARFTENGLVKRGDA
jgi:drug/metabolite transporter (DMT)-like permease